MERAGWEPNVCVKRCGTELEVIEGSTRLGRFAQVAQAVNNDYGVSRCKPSKKTPGQWALSVDDKLFALSSAGAHFIVRLPRERVQALVASSAGRRADRDGLGTDEWLAVQNPSAENWIALAREALRFVRTLD